MLVASGDRIAVKSDGEEFTAFALEDFSTDEDRDVAVRIIGEVGTPDEIGETIAINAKKSTINVASEPEVKE